MPRVLLAIVLSTLVVVPGTRAGQSLSVRPARPDDDVAHASLTEWWQVLAFDPASRTWVRIQFVAKPWPDLELWFRKGSDIARGIGSTAMKVAPHRGPGVTLVASSPIDPSIPPRATLSHTGRAYVVDVRFPTVRAHLKIIPKRAGVTVGPWQLGREQVSWHPPSFVRGTRMWSVPVATGSATGFVEADGHRVVLRAWRAYHDHTWGSFKLSSTTWFHSDFAVRSPRIGEAWILNGLERGYDKGGYRFKPARSPLARRPCPRLALRGERVLGARRPERMDPVPQSRRRLGLLAPEPGDGALLGWWSRVFRAPGVGSLGPDRIHASAAWKQPGARAIRLDRARDPALPERLTGQAEPDERISAPKGL
jgi:hypothetical protein